MKKLVIDPLTRLEGHGRVEIFLDESGAVANAYLQVPDLRGFESFCVGRPAEEMPRLTSRVCGLCPEAHHLASVKALDALFQVEPPPAARLIRELLYCAFFVADHATHFFLLSGPDFLVGPDAPREQRNALGALQILGGTLAKQVLACVARNREVVQLLGGRRVHMVAGLPGGWSRAVSEAERQRIEAAARANVEDALAFLRLFEAVVLRSEEHASLLTDEAFADRTYYLGTVDGAGRPNFYDGDLRVVGPGGAERLRFPAAAYRQHIAERVEPWSYAKFPYLRDVGWRGIADGPESGVYCSSPLGRLNAADGLATPLAQEGYERLYETLGSGKAGGRYLPLHNRLATHWARLVELLYAAERMVELAADAGITDPEVARPPGAACGEGTGSVEAPRGTLIHHYRTDGAGLITAVDMVVGTTHNQAPMALSITRAARALIGRGAALTDELTNRIEMVVRAYDPCFSCAAHAWPGGGGLCVTVRDHRGEVRAVRGPSAARPGTADPGLKLDANGA